MFAYDQIKLGKHLKEVREKGGLTQKQIAKKLGYTSPQFISNIERGTCVTPVETLAKMVRIYEANPNPIIDIILKSQKAFLLKTLTK